MIIRKIEQILRKTLAEYPVVTIFGPRQSGKTTLAKKCCPDFDYISLEDKETRDLAIADYKALFARYRPPLIIDEIQRVPEIASAVQVMVDADRERCGQFVLTGSQQASLAAAVDESLAGRTSVLELLPLSLDEIAETAKGMTADELMLKGFMPELYRVRKDVTSYYRNYFRTYVERDVRRLVNVKDLILFERFVTLLAGRVGQIVSFSALAGETGVSATTIANWMSILEASFLIFRLPPHFNNISKRLVKSPKVYFTDVGLAAYLLGITNASQVARDPLFGGLFENMVFMDLLKTKLNFRLRQDFYYIRDNSGIEVDLVVEQSRRLHLLEVKGAMTPDGSFARNMEKIRGCADEVDSCNVIYSGTDWPLKGGGRFVNYAQASRLLRDISSAAQA